MWSVLAVTKRHMTRLLGIAKNAASKDSTAISEPMNHDPENLVSVTMSAGDTNSQDHDNTDTARQSKQNVAHWLWQARWRLVFQS